MGGMVTVGRNSCCWSCLCLRPPAPAITGSDPDYIVPFAPPVPLTHDFVLSDAPASHSRSHSLSPSLPPALLAEVYARARFLAAQQTASLAWLRLPTPANNCDGGSAVSGYYYYNCLTSQVTVHDPPDRVSLRSSDFRLKPSVDYAAVGAFQCRLEALGVSLECWRSDTRDAHYRSHLQGTPPALPSTLYTLTLLGHVIDTYPGTFWRAVPLRRLVLAETLTFDGAPRDAVPVSETASLYVAVKRQERVFALSLIHHELFHLVDAAWHHRHGTPLRADPRHSGDFDDRAWSALNPPDFAYGRGGAAAESRDPTMSASGAVNGAAVPAGFVSRYATSDDCEDRAETFSAMMRQPRALHCTLTAASFGRALGTEAIVAAKAALVVSRLECFHPALDADWWRRVDASYAFSHFSTVSADQWQRREMAGTADQAIQFWQNPRTNQAVLIR